MSQDKTQQLRQALAAALGSEGNEEFIDKILATLHKEKIIRYHNENDVNLLSTPGRVLVGLIEDPSHTHRSLAIYLNLSETMIDKTIKSLVINGLITKTKQNRQNTYKIQQKLLLNHPDIIHLLAAIGLIVGNSGVATEDLF
jgi:biotin operon repressor